MSEGSLADLDFCYLTTKGRMSGEPHRIEIWFVMANGRVYLLSGGRDRSDWVRNLVVSPTVTLRVGDVERPTKARVVSDPEEDALARRLMLAKYRPRDLSDLSEWGRTALPVVVEWPDE